MRTEIEALKEIRDRISYFCSRTDGKYDPPWAQEVIGIIDDVLITPYRQCKRFGAPFYVEVGTSIVAIRCASNHDVVLRADHSVHGKATIDWAESVCTRMNQEANRRERGDCAKLRKAVDYLCERMADIDATFDPSEVECLRAALGRRREVRAQAKKRCEVCGAAFGPPSSHKRFCSQKCHDRYYAEKRRPKATCEQCGRRFQPLATTPGRFCSQKCYHDWQHEHGEGGRIDRKLAQVSARAQFLARRDLEAKALGGVPVRVSRSRTGLRIESRGNCAGGCAANISHT